LYKISEPFIIRKFDGVVSVTPHIIDKLIKVNKNTFQVTNYPIITNSDISEIKTEKFQIPTIFFAGGVNSLWMHENIIKSLELINFDIKYLIAGPVSNEYLLKLKELKSWGKVEYLGLISYSQVEYYYSKSHIGIAIANYAEAAGGKMGTLGNTKIFEIMKAGLPIICTNFTLWEQIVEENKCGICVNPSDVVAISQAIIKMVTNKQESIQMGQNGKMAVLDKYNWKTQEVILIDMYKNILSI
jgi:glycosyltransferase involved in cell wall biosynthesis